VASTYTTIQGDTWDLIAYKLYGEEKYMKNLIEANWPLLDVLIFPSGTDRA
jgi:phage tail protein X